MNTNMKKRIFALALSAFTAAGLMNTAAWAEEAPAESSFEVSCPAFTLTVPESLKDICTIETEDNGISFYDTASREKMGGFVGGLYVYEGPADYGMNPSFRRGGEIDFPDGSKLDLVWEYPTDVQFDFRDEKIKESYNTIADALDEIGETLVPADEGVFVRQEDIDTTGIYTDILKKLRLDIIEKKDEEGLLADDFSYLYARFYEMEGVDPLQAIGYAFTDVNHDGYSELVIGAVDDYRIYDMFTQVDGEPAHAFSSGERDMYNLCLEYDNVPYFFRNDASGSAAYSEIRISILNPNEPELYPQFSFVLDYEEDPENPYYYQYSFGDRVSATEEEWNDRLEGFNKPYQPEYVPIDMAG